jgi:pimeloyl-ACP methyl ester carboxylesterase
MRHVRSKDGTAIAYTCDGDGPAVVLVGGGLDDGSENAAMVPALTGTFTVVNYARRGRGDSGDTAPYSLGREIEDLAAVVNEVGGGAHAFGASSGGALVLEAAAAGLPLDRIAVWEVPYAVGEDAVIVWQQYVVALREAVNRDDRDRALELFMRLAGSPAACRGCFDGGLSKFA